MSHTLIPIAITNAVGYRSQHFWGGWGGQRNVARKFCLPKEPQGTQAPESAEWPEKVHWEYRKVRVASRTMKAQRNKCDDEEGLLSGDLRNPMPAMKTPTFWASISFLQRLVVPVLGPSQCKCSIAVMLSGDNEHCPLDTLPWVLLQEGKGIFWEKLRNICLRAPKASRRNIMNSAGYVVGVPWVNWLGDVWNIFLILIKLLKGRSEKIVIMLTNIYWVLIMCLKLC